MAGTGGASPDVQPQAAGRWLRGLRFSAFSVIMLGVLVLAVFVLAPTLSTFAEQRAQIAELEASVAEQHATIERLQAERERWNDSTFIATQARERLYYVMPGEVSYLVVNDLALTVDPEAQRPISADVERAEGDWMRSLLTSVMVAGLTPAIDSSGDADG